MKNSRATIRNGGISLVLGAIGFMAVFSYLAANFNYPKVLDGRAGDVLPALLATGTAGRVAWISYAVLPLIFFPAGVAAYQALRQRADGMMRAAMFFAFVAAVAMVAGLMRWPTLHWKLAQSWAAASTEQRTAMEATFNSLNFYLGNCIGEFLGELSFSLFFLLSALAMLQNASPKKWVASWGIVTGSLGLIGMWRNVTSIVQPVADINNFLLPLWMIGFGVWLVMASRHTASHEGVASIPREATFSPS